MTMKAATLALCAVLFAPALAVGQDEPARYRAVCAAELERVRDFHVKAGASRAEIDKGIDQVIAQILEFTDPAPIRDYMNGFFDQSSDPKVRVEGDMWICLGRE